MSLFKNVNVVYNYVTDWEKAKKFYREVLDWPVAWSDDQVGWEEYGLPESTHLAINRWDSDKPLPVNTSVTVVLTVEDCQAVINDLRARGIKCEDVVSIPGVVTYGSFYDLDGNRIQFAQS